MITGIERTLRRPSYAQNASVEQKIEKLIGAIGNLEHRITKLAERVDQLDTLARLAIRPIVTGNEDQSP